MTCRCESFSPGMTRRPPRSITRVPAPRCAITSASLPTALKRPPAIATASARPESVSPMTKRPLRSTDVCGHVASYARSKSRSSTSAERARISSLRLAANSRRRRRRRAVWPFSSSAPRATCSQALRPGRSANDTASPLAEQRRVEIRVAVDRERSVARVARRDQPQLAAPLVGGEGLLLVARREALALGLDPDLQEVHGLRAVGIELAVLDAGARRHALHVARADHGARAQAVLVLERAVEHVGDDLHVAVAVRAEAGARLHAVFVDHAQRAEAHVLRDRSSRRTRTYAGCRASPGSPCPDRSRAGSRSSRTSDDSDADGFHGGSRNETSRGTSCRRLFHQPVTGAGDDDALDVGRDQSSLLDQRRRRTPSRRSAPAWACAASSSRAARSPRRPARRLGSTRSPRACARLGVGVGVEAAIRLGDRARAVGGEVVPEVLEVDPLAARDELQRHLAVEMEVPQVAQQPDALPVADTGQERVHQHDALDRRAGNCAA